MTLSLGLDVAVNSLANTAERASVASRNITSAHDPAASRKRVGAYAVVSGDGARLGTVERAANHALSERLRGAAADHAFFSTLSARMDELQNIFGSFDDGRSPADQITALHDALVQFASAPAEKAAADAAVTASKSVAATLRKTSEEVAGVRARADADVARHVDRLNVLFAEFSQINASIVTDVRAGRDVSDTEDARDTILAEVNGIVGIRTLMRAEKDMVVLTEGGTTLFERAPREISFQPSGRLADGVPGHPVLVDGLPLNRSVSGLREDGGALVGLLQVRDRLAPTLQLQLDEMARGLVATFSETDQIGGGAADRPGLFTFAGASGIPPAGSVVPGIAHTIRVAASVDPDHGGDPLLLRDGGISDPGNPTYIANTAGASGFADRLHALADGLDADRAFDASARLEAVASVHVFAQQSTGWIAAQRKSAHADAIAAQSVVERARLALSNETGISLDDEMTRMLEIERSYQATARLISTIDGLYDTLLAAVR